VEPFHFCGLVFSTSEEMVGQYRGKSGSTIWYLLDPVSTDSMFGKTNKDEIDLFLQSITRHTPPSHKVMEGEDIVSTASNC
jgi:hypothetical protein